MNIWNPKVMELALVQMIFLSVGVIFLGFQNVKFSVGFFPSGNKCARFLYDKLFPPVTSLEHFLLRIFVEKNPHCWASLEGVSFEIIWVISGRISVNCQQTWAKVGSFHTTILMIQRS